MESVDKFKIASYKNTLSSVVLFQVCCSSSTQCKKTLEQSSNYFLVGGSRAAHVSFLAIALTMR
jgi:hypothetical protein